MKVEGRDYRTIWLEGSSVKTINQPMIPHRFEVVSLDTHDQTAEAIRTMVLRGAGAIGAAGAFGMAQVFMEAPPEEPARGEYIDTGYETLRTTRPTAQDLFWALDRVRSAAEAVPEPQAADAAAAESQRIADEYVEAGRLIGQYGAPLLTEGACVLTHCNAGWLAFVDWGSALAPVYVAHRAGRKVSVLADETRPRGQGARLTAWELQQEGVEVRIIADNAAGLMMRRGEVDLVITGADRIAANGDVANKIGTYEKALCAQANEVPFYVAAPVSTFDLACPDGDHIPIERRADEEVLYAYGRDDAGEFSRVRLAPEGVEAVNLAFDVTPAELIAGLITDRGIIAANPEEIARVIGGEE
ncbi:MAG: S-methyl-5-thioribose-1-phosphate isomerase [Planctomycetota bacterium]|jgi:methylthioribose-1-phosphate isomerase